MNPRAAAVEAYGVEAVEAYELVKRFYTRLGRAIERAYAERVGGRVGGPGEADVITRLGSWEFCAAATRAPTPNALAARSSWQQRNSFR